MNTWLDTRVKAPIINDYQSLTRNVTDYYTENDSEIINQDHEFNKFSEYSGPGNQRYDDIYDIPDKEIIININTHTRRYEADIIFRKLIDTCIINNFDNETLLNPKLKKSFYKFIKENS